MNLEREIKVSDAIKYCIENFDSKTASNRIVEFFKNELKAQEQAIGYSRSCTELICEFDKIIDGSLTKGKKYTKIHEHKGMVVIINDFDEVMSYNKEVFFKEN